MPNVAINIRTEKLEELKKALAGIKNGVPKAIASAINDTTKTMKTRVSRDVRERVNIKKRDIDPFILRKPLATPAKQTGVLTVQSQRRLGLHYFGARQTAKGITYKIDKKGGRSLLPGAFGFPKGKGNFRWVAIRKGKKRHPVRFPGGVSAYGVFLKAGIMDRTVVFSQEELHKALDERVRFMLLVASGKVAATKARTKTVLD